MTADSHVLEMLIFEFPEFRSRITELYYNSSNFVEACDDYVLGIESIKQLEATKDLKKEKEIVELKQVMAEMREELMCIIKE
jgi:uncharacterized protein YdcH (DUF465 family)